MNKALLERNMVVVLFILVLVTFSFAQRDTKKLEKLYTTNKAAASKLFSKAPRVAIVTKTLND